MPTLNACYRFLVCTLHKLGLNKENVYDDLKAAVVAAPQFRCTQLYMAQLMTDLSLADLTGSSRVEQLWSSRGDAIL